MPDSGKNRYFDEHGELKAVEDFSIFDGFSCGHDGLDEFLFQYAKDNQKELLFKVYSYSLNAGDEENFISSEPVAFLTLFNNSQDLEIEDIKDKGLNAPYIREFKYRFPAVSIGHMGVHIDYQRKSIGTNILNLVKYIFVTNNKTGCRFINLQSINSPGVMKFYRQNDFEPTSLLNTLGEVVPMFCDLLRFKSLCE